MNRVLGMGGAPSCCTGAQPPAPRGQRQVLSAWVAVAGGGGVLPAAGLGLPLCTARSQRG